MKIFNMAKDFFLIIHFAIMCWHKICKRRDRHGEWRTLSDGWLRDKLLEEVGELKKELDDTNYCLTTKEAVDVAAVSFMLYQRAKWQWRAAADEQSRKH